MREQPDQVKRFLRANVKGLRYMRENRDVALETAMSWLKVDREMAEFGIKIEKLSQVVDFTLLHQVLKEAR